MTDYRRMLTLAGLNESEVVRIAAEAEQADTMDAEQDAADAASEKQSGFEKLIALHCRKTGLELAGPHSIYIEGDRVELTLADEPHGYPLAQILDFTNKMAADGIGQNVKISGNAANNVVLYFDLLG